MKTRKKKARPEYSVVAAYPDYLYWDSEKNYDNRLHFAAGEKHRVGSGMGFGFRDIEWSYKTEQGAKNALARIKKLRLRGVKASIQVFEED